MSIKYFYFIFSIFSVVLSPTVQAHSNLKKDNYFLANLSITARDSSYQNDANQNSVLWQVPGALLGGEAVPAEQGITLDDANLQFGYAFSQNGFISSSIVAHNHDGETSLEVDNLFLSYPFGQHLNLDIGQYSTYSTETAVWHASRATYSEASLTSDLLFGRHVSDVGIRLIYNKNNFDMGIEIGNGDAWPGSSGEGSVNLYTKYQFEVKQVTTKASLWVQHAKADNRVDTRLTDTHNHGTNNITGNNNEENPIAFSGDTDLGGILLEALLPLGNIEFSSELEWVISKSGGELNDVLENSAYENEYDVLRFLISAQMSRHAVSLQYESATLKNIFLDSVSPNFLARSYLDNNGFEPSKISASWRWNATENLLLRLEWYNDKTIDKDGEDHFGLGVRWNRNFAVFN